MVGALSGEKSRKVKRKVKIGDAEGEKGGGGSLDGDGESFQGEKTTRGGRTGGGERHTRATFEIRGKGKGTNEGPD